MGARIEQRNIDDDQTDKPMAFKGFSPLAADAIKIGEGAVH